MKTPPGSFLSCGLAVALCLLLVGCYKTERDTLANDVARISTERNQLTARVAELEKKLTDKDGRIIELQTAALQSARAAEEARNRSAQALKEAALRAEKAEAETVRKAEEIQRATAAREKHRKNQEAMTPVLRSLTALRAAIQGGVNRDRYAELINAARSEIGVAKLTAGQLPALAQAERYVVMHAVVSAVWNKLTTTRAGSTSWTSAYISKDDDEDVFAALEKFFPAAKGSLNSTGSAYSFLEINMLWTDTESLWPQVEGAFASL